MKKLMTLVVAGFLAFTLAACSNSANTSSSSSSSTPSKVTVKSLNGSSETVDVEVTYNPSRVAVLDYAALDAIDSLGVGDKVVGTSKVSVDYLKSYSENSNIKNLGTIKEADTEAVAACEPDVIFIGGRLASSYDELSKIAPVVYLEIASGEGVVEGTKRIAETIGTIFGKQDQVSSLMSGYDSRIAKLKEFANGKTAMVGLCTSGSFNILGNDGRCSLIGNEIGFNNIGDSITSSNNGSTSTHGNESSFELLVSLNPEYIFVLDRDAAIGTEGAQLAQEILANELVMGIDAYKNNKIVYLSTPKIWYTAEGGVKALDYMLKDLESALLS